MKRMVKTRVEKPVRNPIKSDFQNNNMFMTRARINFATSQTS